MTRQGILAVITVLFSGILSAASNTIVIYALYYDTYLTGEPEEAFAITNVSLSPIIINGWQVTDGEGTVSFVSERIWPNQIIWASKTATAFREEFGFNPDYEYGGDSDPAVADLIGTAPAFADTGDEIILKDNLANTVDVLVYEGGNTLTLGWSGPALYPYDNGAFGLEGQILFRKISEDTTQPVPDTDTLADWAQDPNDSIHGKKVRYPGWDYEWYFATIRTLTPAHLEYWVAPDNILGNYLYYINRAATQILIEGYTFKSPQIAMALFARQDAGVFVKVLLECEPEGGIDDQEKWVAQQIEAHGGEVYFMYDNGALGVHDRYDYQHAKFTLIDYTWLLTGSENLNGSSMPADNLYNGTDGNRGIYIATDAPDLVTHAHDVFFNDVDPTNHKDIRRWDPATDSPPSGFIPDYGGDPTTYKVEFWNPLVLDGNIEFELVQSPETSLRETDSLLGMIERVPNRGRVLVEQLYEYKYWGPTTSNPVDDPNLRLEAYIAAARRGAEVRILLDSVFNDPLSPRGNTATCVYVNNIATTEGLDLQCKVGSPTVTGIHNKMVLIWTTTEGWTHTGSINGSENSNKNNREMAVQVRSTAGYKYLEAVFNHDWVTVGGEPLETTPPGEPMFQDLIKHEGNLEITWTAPPAGCNTFSYGLYVGDLTTFQTGTYSHDTALGCNLWIPAEVVALDDPRLPAKAYFLIVANNAAVEGSYGRKTGPEERPMSGNACKGWQDTGSCP